MWTLYKQIKHKAPSVALCEALTPNSYSLDNLIERYTQRHLLAIKSIELGLWGTSMAFCDDLNMKDWI